jgi:branched-chain amino acid transport system substrate-binding protein
VKGRAAALLLVLLAGLAAGCGGDDSAKPVAASSCGRVLYEGDGEPDFVVVSDFPLRGVGAENTRVMVDAIEFVFRQRGFRAGEHRVGYQSCNDTVGDEPFDALLCRRNARAYVAAKDVVGVIGPWNSGCAWEQIPIISRKTAGPLAMVSPSNTYTGLTRTLPGEPSGEALYPDGLRSYARVVTHDQAQGVAAAQLAAQLGARRVVLLQQVHVDDPYARGLSQPFLEAAEKLGLAVRRLAWRPGDSYARLARDAAAERPDAVFLAGLTQGNAKELVEDLRAELGASLPLIGPDSFAAEDVAQGLGAAGEGMYVTDPGIHSSQLPPAGKRFLRAFGRPAGDVEHTWVPEAAQATEVLLDAIGRSDGTRASVVDELFATKVENGILGSFSFDRFGDIVPAPVAVYRIRGGDLVTETVLRAPLDAIDG